MKCGHGLRKAQAPSTLPCGQGFHSRTIQAARANVFLESQTFVPPDALSSRKARDRCHVDLTSEIVTAGKSARRFSREARCEAAAAFRRDARAIPRTSAVKTSAGRGDARGMRTEAEVGPLDDLADDARPTRRRRCSHAESDPSSSLLCRLPHDLAARVLATLPPSARARCAAVSRGWRNLLRDLPPQQLWRELDFTRDDREVRADAASLRYRASRRFFLFRRAPTRISSTRADAPFPRS